MPTQRQLVAAVRDLLVEHGRLQDPMVAAGGGLERFVQSAGMNAVIQGRAEYDDFFGDRIPQHAFDAALEITAVWLAALPRRDALAREDQEPLGEIALHGRFEHAWQLLSRVPGATPGQVKRRLPRAWDAGLKTIVTRPVDVRLLDRAFPARTYTATGTGWPEDTGPASTRGPQTVLMLSTRDRDLPLDPQLLAAVRSSSEHSGHPFVRGLWAPPAPRGPQTTLGWIRYDWIGEVLLVEELQSDVAGVRQQAAAGNTPAAREVLAWAGEALPAIYEDLLALAVETAWSQPHVVAVEMHDADTMAALYALEGLPAPPRSVYTDLPRAAGFSRQPRGGYRFEEVLRDRLPAGARPWRLDLPRP